MAEWLAGKGMACSVYAAQYLLEGLFENEAGEKAVGLIVAPGDRSWRHMVESGTTITWEAWDQKYKPNQDWNHAWGAAPANILPKYVLGAQPLLPGWKRVLIKPHPSGLSFAKGKIPTPLGPLPIYWKIDTDFMLLLNLPPGMSGKIELPASPASKEVLASGKPVAAHREGNWWLLDQDVTGTVTLEVK